MTGQVVRARHVDIQYWLVLGVFGSFFLAGIAGCIAAQVAALIQNRPAPSFAIAHGALAWFRESPDFERGPAMLFYIVAGLVFLAGIAVVTVIVRLFSQLTSISSSRFDAKELPGMADRGEVKRAASARAIVSRAGSLRPSLTKPAPEDVGYFHGTSRGLGVWSTVEDAVVVVGPTRSGKGVHIVVNAILDAPGAVLTTSTRPDNLTLTMKQRAKIGPVAVFDPQQMVPGIPAGVKWSPVRGCRDPQTAMVRARGFAGATGLDGGGVENGGFWQGQTESVIRSMLHAADLGGRDARDLYRWSIDPVAANQEAGAILESSPDAAPGWAATLQTQATADPRQRDSVWMGVRQAFASLGDPRVLDAVLPGPGEQFDPEKFLRDRGTVYLLGTATMASVLGGLVSAFTEDVIETARQLAARQPGARLDPPLGLVLDEIANFVGLPSLPALMSEGGGSGITTIAVFQSLAQVRDKWGQQTANAIWDSAVVKLILGGGSNSDDFRDLSNLLGERDETTVSISTGRGLFETSESSSVRKVPIMSPDQLRRMPFGQALMLLRSARPMIVTMRRYDQRKDAAALKQDRRELETLIQEHV